MEYEIELSGVMVNYTLTASVKAKRMRLVVRPGGELVVTSPKRVSKASVERFLQDHSEWIIEKIKILSLLSKPLSKTQSLAHYREHKERAKMLAVQKVEFFNEKFLFNYKNITIRNQKTRWGSCSKSGNLNFNYKIALLPEHLVDYIVVHELCHLREFNHGEKFWDLVSSVIKEHKTYRQELKKHGLSL